MLYIFHYTIKAVKKQVEKNFKKSLAFFSIILYNTEVSYVNLQIIQGGADTWQSVISAVRV